MSLRRRIVDGVNSVMDKVAADDTPLSHVDEVELEEELERRQVMGKRTRRAPGDNPRARWAGGSEAAAKQRKAAADKRAAKIGSVRRKRDKAERNARERAFRDVQEQARRQQRSEPRASRGASGGSRASGRRRPRSPLGGKDAKIARYYKVLNLPYGVGFDEVKSAFRKLVRKYHPDRHGGSPQKQKAATELTMRVTQAYNELEQHLTGGRKRGR